jgi:nicotinamidase-related amidase
MPAATHGPPKNDDLHGNVPDDSPVVLLVIDVINDMEFEGGAELLAASRPMSHMLAGFIARAREAGIAVIYANDNFGRWRSDFRSLLRHCQGDDVRGREIARRLAPADDDYFVLKPKHSAFFSTSLDTLLAYLGARTLILTGMTTDSCILVTAIEADMRDMRVIVPEDCVAATTARRHERALEHLRDALDAEVVASEAIDFERLVAEARETAAER